MRPLPQIRTPRGELPNRLWSRARKRGPRPSTQGGGGAARHGVAAVRAAARPVPARASGGPSALNGPTSTSALLKLAVLATVHRAMAACSVQCEESGPAWATSSRYLNLKNFQEIPSREGDVLVRMVHTAGSNSHCSCIISSTVISNELDVNLYPES